MCCKIDEKIWMFKNIEKIIYGFIVKSYYIPSFSIMENTSNILGWSIDLYVGSTYLVYIVSSYLFFIISKFKLSEKYKLFIPDFRNELFKWECLQFPIDPYCTKYNVSVSAYC